MAKMPLQPDKVPMLSLAINTGTAVDKQNDTAKDVPASKAPMTAASMPTWKPPTHAERVQNAAKDELVNSFRDWVSGRIDTAKHKSNMKRAKEAMCYKD